MAAGECSIKEEAIDDESEASTAAGAQLQVSSIHHYMLLTLLHYMEGVVLGVGKYLKEYDTQNYSLVAILFSSTFTQKVIFKSKMY